MSNNWLKSDINLQERHKKRKDQNILKALNKYDEEAKQKHDLVDPIIKLINKVLLDFSNQARCGYKEMKYIQEIDTVGWRHDGARAVWKCAQADIWLKEGKEFRVVILYKEPWLFFWPKVWIEFRYVIDYARLFSVPATEDGLKRGFKKIYRILTR